MEKEAQWFLAASHVQPDLPAVPAGVEVERRVGIRKQILLFQNFSAQQQTISLLHAMTDILTGQTAHSITLPEYGVAILSAAAQTEQALTDPRLSRSASASEFSTALTKSPR